MKSTYWVGQKKQADGKNLGQVGCGGGVKKLQLEIHSH